MRTTGKATDLITFSRSSGGTALRKIAYGPELVTNGTFDTDSDWTKEASWTISGGTATYDGAVHVETLSQHFSLTTGKIIKISYTVKNVAAGKTAYFNVKGNSGAGALYKQYTNHTEGDYEIITTVAEDAVGLVFIALNSGTGGAFDLDNISVKEVLFDQGDLTLFNHPADIPRIEYDANGNVLGLLVEEARVNLESKSTPSTSDAVRANTTIAETDDILGLSAMRVTTSSGNSNDGLIVGSTLSVTAGTTYTFSAFYRFPDPAYEAILQYAGGLAVRMDSSGVIINTTAYLAFLGASVTATVDSLPNGVFRLSVTAECQSNNTSAIWCGPNPGTAGAYVEVAGRQLEAGAFPTSYIPTSGSTATRAADVASIATSEFGYRDDEGTVVVETTGINGDVVAALGNETFNTDLRFGLLSVNQAARATSAAGYPKLVAIGGYTGQSKIAVAMKEDDYAGSCGGNAVNTDTSASMPQNPNKLQIGKDYAGFANGHIKSIKYIPRRLTNDQLVEITS